MESLGDVWDFSFFWGVFGFILKLVAPFLMIIIAITAVGLLLFYVVQAIRNRN
ncbi:PTS ascorbate transporter subunit IIC [Anaerobacillus alkalidiazotrophicus]|uniref:PTS ascorbate transporter subunit IIC n=1 Tax=Anaerobacillus alkalidiazotrophicus TaxID=472963 RepID=A0A1S2MBA6_9BACI|nr:PTS ascorbate transporter subunit IIC [Anaerobacillus alkalidiazotrophicus]OIJ22048.1 PTS ascorbate transporter subunit IIC [Anaerobacillus alkalidiazotrophicus]